MIAPDQFMHLVLLQVKPAFTFLSTELVKAPQLFLHREPANVEKVELRRALLEHNLERPLQALVKEYRPEYGVTPRKYVPAVLEHVRTEQTPDPVHRLDAINLSIRI